jgi:hypothetical protein
VARTAAGVPVYWGVTSVTSERSQRYWLTRNRAVFPAGFEPTLAWHRRFAAEALEFAERHDTHVYFMPIRVGIQAWLGDVTCGDPRVVGGSAHLTVAESAPIRVGIHAWLGELLT